MVDVEPDHAVDEHWKLTHNEAVKTLYTSKGERKETCRGWR